jgi:hypothetical protein
VISLVTQSGTLQTSGSRYSQECLAREAELIRVSEAHIPTDFDGLASWMGYSAGKLRKAIGGARTRDGVLQAILNHARVSEKANRVALADAYLREVSGSLSMAAE